MTIITLALISSTSLFAWVDHMNYRGNLNSWGETSLSKSDLTTVDIWEITIQSPSADSNEFKFANYGWNNSWTSGGSLNTDTKATFTFNSGGNTIINGMEDNKYYIFHFKDNGYANTDAIVMETSSQPSSITDVSDTANAQREVQANVATTVTITLNQNKVSEEKVYVRYTSNFWASSTLLLATGDTNIWEADIPGMAGSGVNVTTAEYYVLTTTLSSGSDLSDNTDLVTINFDNNSGPNYRLYVVPEPTAILFLLFGLGFAALRK